MAFRTNKVPVLQTKSASGSVATFNTALAMPLPSCKIAVNAWQEGSGDPSPSNVRPIHGFDKVNLYQRAVNLWDEEWELGGYWNDTGLPRPLTDRIRCKNAIPIKQNTEIYTPFSMAFLFYDINDNVLPSVSRTGYSRADNMYLRQSGNTEGKFLIPQGAYYMRFYMQSAYGTTYNNDISINYPSTDTDYHAYTGNTYTIQLGQEVYGAEVDVVNGVAHVTHNIITYDSSAGWNQSSADSTIFSRSLSTEFSTENRTPMCNLFTPIVRGNSSRLQTNQCCFNSIVSVFNVKVDGTQITDLTDWDNFLSNNPLVIRYLLANPFDIQLTPTQIETLIGNNTIFADTGDVDLTYKDLDIAKRGNFREVFRLPS